MTIPSPIVDVCVKHRIIHSSEPGAGSHAKTIVESLLANSFPECGESAVREAEAAADLHQRALESASARLKAVEGRFSLREATDAELSEVEEEVSIAGKRARRSRLHADGAINLRAAAVSNRAAEWAKALDGHVSQHSLYAELAPLLSTLSGVYQELEKLSDAIFGTLDEFNSRLGVFEVLHLLSTGKSNNWRVNNAVDDATLISTMADMNALMRYPDRNGAPNEDLRAGPLRNPAFLVANSARGISEFSRGPELLRVVAAFRASQKPKGATKAT